MRLHLITSTGACGIADYGQSLAAALPASWKISGLDRPEWLDPRAYQQIFEGDHPEPLPDLVWLNYHAGLHSRWDRWAVRDLQQAGIPVGLTYHDTLAGTPEQPSPERLQELHSVADAVVVHEPVGDLDGVHLIRHGIPRPVWQYLRTTAPLTRPTLGTVGFNFPWKNYDRLAAFTADLGWGLLIVCANATQDDVRRWRELNPYTTVVSGWQPQERVVAYLSSCSATAFMYECANTGVSGAIRQGIAALRPVYALESCRQFRDLQWLESHELDLGLIEWVSSWEMLKGRLLTTPLTPSLDPRMVYLAQLDSWTNQGRRYAEVMQETVAHRRRLI